MFSDVRESLPQTLANLEIVIDMLKRYHKGVEQTLVVLPAGRRGRAGVATIFTTRRLLDFSLDDQPAAAVPDRLPARVRMALAGRHHHRAAAQRDLLQDPEGLPANVVRGARNYPCADVPGKRAATPRECRSNEPYVPLGTNPWYGDPNQILNCPAPGARCDQPVKPGRGHPGTVDQQRTEPTARRSTAAAGTARQRPVVPARQGTVQCSGQQPNPCIYTPASGTTAVYSPQSGEVVGPDGVKYSVTNSTNTGDDGWKEMLAPAS